MFAVILTVVAVAVATGFVYVVRERSGVRGLVPTALRTAGLGALLLLFFNPGHAVPTPESAPTVLLDASLSLGTAGGKWQPALDTALSLAGTSGVVTRFGTRVVPFDTARPSDGRSSLGDALRVAHARDRPIVVVTDGEVEDFDLMGSPLLDGVAFVLLPRDTLLNAAMLTLDAPTRAQAEDSVVLISSIGLWGVDAETAGRLEAFTGNRRLASADVVLPVAPSVARRRVVLRAGTLGPGVHVLRVRVTVSDDVEPNDDERFAVVTVTEQPAAVVLVNPADWEGRFLVATLRDVLRGAVTGYARVGPDLWLEMGTHARVDESAMRATRDAAALVVRRGVQTLSPSPRRRQAEWRWPAGSDDQTEFFRGDWYVSGDISSSPLAGDLARIEWDSLPPLLGVVPLVATGNEWVALSVRRSRRGAVRPVILGSDSAGIRTLTTAGAGLWRWGLRGGAAREAYRALLASGTEWLLGDDASRPRTLLSARPVVARGEPIVFRWSGDTIPDSLTVTLIQEDAGDRRVVLRFDDTGLARHDAPPGIYRWSTTTAPPASGVIVVETYSPEFAPRPVRNLEGGGEGSVRDHVERYARERWWLFVLAVLAFTGEWAWRYRRGLP